MRIYTAPSIRSFHFKTLEMERQNEWQPQRSCQTVFQTGRTNDSPIGCVRELILILLCTFLILSVFHILAILCVEWQFTVVSLHISLIAANVEYLF